MRALMSIVAAMAMLVAAVGPATAATPASGELSDEQRSLTFSGGPFVVPNRTDPLLGDGTTHVCVPGAAPCDEFALTVSLPAGFVALHPDARVRVALAARNGTSDYDIYVRNEAGEHVAVGYNAGGMESAEFSVGDGTHRYTIQVSPWSTNAAAYDAEVSLLAADPTADADGDGVPNVLDVCPGTAAGAKVDDEGCTQKDIRMPSDPDRPRVVVADIDSAINPYHEFYYQRPSVVTREVLEDIGVKPENVVQLTRTGDFAADIAADAGFWASVERGELYHFLGTNIIATSLGNSQPYLKPVAAKNPHGVGTSAAVINANPDAIIFFIEANDALGSAESHAAAFQNPAVDIVTTSYGISFGAGLLPAPEYRAFEHTYEGVVERGMLHFSSGGNGPGVTALRGGAGPWWSIGVSGIQEGESEGDTLLSGNLPDFVSDFTQRLPYCIDCESGEARVSGTSFSTPRSAGLASRVLLELRTALRHEGGVRHMGGTPVMATNTPANKGKAKKCGTKIDCVSVTNWQLRRALEQAAWIPQDAYDPTQASAGGIGLPIAPAGQWAQTAWGDLTTDPSKGVFEAALAELSSLTGYQFGGTPRVKPIGYCEFQTAVIEARKAWWNEVAPTLPDNPELTGETPPGAPGQDPFVYCSPATP